MRRLSGNAGGSEGLTCRAQLGRTCGTGRSGVGAGNKAFEPAKPESAAGAERRGLVCESAAGELALSDPAALSFYR